MYRCPVERLVACDEGAFDISSELSDRQTECRY